MKKVMSKEIGIKKRTVGDRMELFLRPTVVSIVGCRSFLGVGPNIFLHFGKSTPSRLVPRGRGNTNWRYHTMLAPPTMLA